MKKKRKKKPKMIEREFIQQLKMLLITNQLIKLKKNSFN